MWTYPNIMCNIRTMGESSPIFILMCFMFSPTLDPPFPCCPLMSLWHPLKSLAICNLLNILCCFFNVVAIFYYDYVTLVIFPFFGIFKLDWCILLSPIVSPWPHLDNPLLSSITFNVYYCIGTSQSCHVALCHPHCPWCYLTSYEMSFKPKKKP